MEEKLDTVNDKERAGHIPDAVRTAMEENEGDAFCLELYEQYLKMKQENEETVSIEDAAQQLNVHLPGNK